MRIISATPILWVRSIFHAPAKFLAGDIALALTMLLVLTLGGAIYLVVMGAAMFASYVLVQHLPPGQFFHETILSLLMKTVAADPNVLPPMPGNGQMTVLALLLMVPAVPFLVALYAAPLLLALFFVKQVLEDRLLFLMIIFLITLFEIVMMLNHAPSPMSNVPGYYVGAEIRDFVIAAFLLMQAVAILLLRLSPSYRASLRWPRFRFWTFVARYGFRSWSSWRKLAARSLIVFWKVLLRLFALLLTMALIEFLAGAIAGARWGGFGPAEMARGGVVLLVLDMVFLAAIATYELWRHPGFRFYNAIFLMLALFFLAVAASEAHDVFDRGRPVEPFLATVGWGWKLFVLFAFRSWILAPLVKDFDRLRAELAVTAGELTRRIQAPPVLFLRSFQNDDAWTLSSFRVISWVFGRREARASIEQVVAEAVFPYGPLIALADPSKSFPPIGAAQDAVSDEADWREVVLNHIDRAALIVVCLASTLSLRWEIETLIDHGVLDKTVFVFPPSYPGLALLLQSHPRLVDLIEADAAQTRVSGIRALSWSKRESLFVGIRAHRSTQSAYAEAIRIAAGVEVGGPSRKGPFAPK